MADVLSIGKLYNGFLEFAEMSFFDDNSSSLCVLKVRHEIACSLSKSNLIYEGMMTVFMFIAFAAVTINVFALLLLLSTQSIIFKESGLKTSNSSIIGQTSYVILNDSVFATSLCNTRLGNVLSSVASLYAYKAEYGLVPLIPMHMAKLICYYFECPEEVMILERILPNWENITWVKFSPYDQYCFDEHNSSTLNASLGNYLDIGRYPHDLIQIRKHLPRLKNRFFKMKNKYQEHARQKLRQAAMSYKARHKLQKNDSVQFIGIHIRRSDYITHLEPYNLTFVGKDYFTKAMNLFRSNEKHSIFIIVSEDMEWAKKNIISIGGDCFFPATGLQAAENDTPDQNFTTLIASAEIGNDLCLLTQVNHSILTYGTFGTWGALLSGSGKVILPRGYEQTYTLREIKKANFSDWSFI